MTPRVFRAIGLLVACLLALGPGASRTAALTDGPLKAASSASTAGADSRITSIVGAAWNADNSPIPHARIRLRNAATGRIEATAIANEDGQFSFTGVEGGTYVIELVSESGKVLTLSHTFSVAFGETVATFVRLGTRRRFDGFFATAAAAAVSTAASTGITAIAPGVVRPVSAQK